MTKQDTPFDEPIFRKIVREIFKEEFSAFKDQNASQLEHEADGIKREFRVELQSISLGIVREIKAHLKLQDNKIDAIMTKLDGMVGEMENYRNEQSVNQLHHDDMNKKINKLEKIHPGGAHASM